MFDVLPRSLFNRGNCGIKHSYHYNGRVIAHDMHLSSNDLAAKTLHSYVTLLELLYAFSTHTRSSSPHGTDQALTPPISQEGGGCTACIMVQKVSLLVALLV